MARKVFVEITAKFDTEGKITPLSLLWEDGMVYEIDRVLDIRRAASLKAGGTGIRYTIQIGGRQSYLFYEDPKWFVEAKESCADDIPYLMNRIQRYGKSLQKSIKNILRSR